MIDLPKVGRYGLLTILICFWCSSCNRPVPSSRKVTLVLVDRGWFEQKYRDLMDRQFQEFKARTGIDVQLLPGPESAAGQLALWQKLLRHGPEPEQVHPDVFGIDVIWPGILADALLDLKPYVKDESANDFPDLIANWTVNGRIIALPNMIDIPLLYYRTDLLERYGYRTPPATWDELEKMAARIERGERDRGKKDFWGFAWPGGMTDSLTSAALAWQASEGGGRIIEPDGRVSVNNPQAIRAWSRAADWVGFISPPGVTAFKESDVLNLWLAGGVAFMQHWQVADVISRSEGSEVRDRFASTLLPRGKAGRAEVLGGAGYAVSLRSTHPKEAIALVRFLCSRNTQAQVARIMFTPPTIPDLYEELQKENPHFREVKRGVLEGTVARPSTVAGEKYAEVSAAFSEAVHSVLVRDKSGTAAAAALERNLGVIMNSKRPSPK